MKTLIILLLCLFFINKPLLAGIPLVEKTFVLKSDQYPPLISELNPSLVFVTFRGRYSCINGAFLVKDSIRNLNGLLNSLQCGTIGYRLVYKDAVGELDSVKQYDSKFRTTDRMYNYSKSLLSILLAIQPASIQIILSSIMARNIAPRILKFQVWENWLVNIRFIMLTIEVIIQ